MTFDINTCTLQEAMDYAVKKIVEQGYRCYDEEEDDCLYADGKGGHCAIGWLLDHNDAELMGYMGGVEDISNEFGKDRLPSLIYGNIYAFGWLQQFHDVDKHGGRYSAITELEKLGIDTSGKHWQDWVGLQNGESNK